MLVGAPVLKVLSELPRTSEFVIPGPGNDKPRIGLKRPWAAIKRYAQLPKLRLHDLRHSYASIAAGAGIGFPIIGKLLGHAQPSTTARYTHLADDPLRRASETIAVHIATAMGEMNPERDRSGDEEQMLLKGAIRLAAHFGCAGHTGVAVPTARLAQDFVSLAIDYRCPSKVHFEVLYPFIHALPAIEEREVFTGWNADFYYGNGKEDLMRQRRLIAEGLSRSARKAIFDEERRTVINAELRNPSNATWWFAQRIALRCGKTLFASYLDHRVCDYFLRWIQTICRLLEKPLVRQALAEELAGAFCQSIASVYATRSRLAEALARCSRRCWIIPPLMASKKPTLPYRRSVGGGLVR